MTGYLLKKLLGSSVGIAVVHAIVFWIAFFQNGGFHDSAKGFSRGVADFGRAIGAGFGGSESGWVTVQRILGWPLAAVDVSGQAAFVCLMVLNSVLWGVVLGLAVAFALRLARKR